MKSALVALCATGVAADTAAAPHDAVVISRLEKGTILEEEATSPNPGRTTSAYVFSSHAHHSPFLIKNDDIDEAITVDEATIASTMAQEEVSRTFWFMPYMSLLGLGSVDSQEFPIALSLVAVDDVVHGKHEVKTDEIMEGNKLEDVADTDNELEAVYRSAHKNRKSQRSLPTHTTFWIHCITFSIIIKGLCVIGNIGMSLAPMYDINEIRRKKDTGAYDSLPFLCTMSTGSQWCFYGIFAWLYTGNKGFLVILYANTLSAVLGVFYSITFIWNCSHPETWRKLTTYCKMIAYLFIFEMMVLYFLPMEKGLLFCGSVASFLSIVVTLSPLSTLPLIYESKSVESMPVELSLVSFASSFVWLVCGIMLHDYWILFPNILGIFVGSYSTYLIIKFSDYFDGFLRKIFWPLPKALKEKGKETGCFDVIWNSRKDQLEREKMPLKYGPRYHPPITYGACRYPESSSKRLASVLDRAAAMVEDKEERKILEQYRDSVVASLKSKESNSISSPSQDSTCGGGSSTDECFDDGCTGGTV